VTWFSGRLETTALIQESTLQLQWPVEVRRSARRRTLEVRATWDNRVRVLCPMILNDVQIADFVSAKSGWIESKLRINASKINGSSQIITAGSILFFRGQTLTLVVTQAERTAITLDQARLIVKAPGNSSEALNALLRDWFYQRAKDILLERTEFYSQALGHQPTKIIFKAYRSMWGRCNARGEIAFDWRIVMAPDSVIEYLVVHELCHLTHFDHSSRFWDLVESVKPDFRESKSWLRANARWIKQMFENDSGIH
jgi:predicted metal-dependent hydrolase